MDGVTDASFRFISAKYGKPDIIYTEFTSAEGLAAGALRLLDDFRFSSIERPIVAQIFGTSPTAFYTAAVVATALGFDGIDINMGCPAKNITERGAGAALISTPERAVQLIEAVKRGTQDYANHPVLSDYDLTPTLVAAISERTPISPPSALPVSVKTRLGITHDTSDQWIPLLVSCDLAAICLHGRTLRQLYSGEANWEAIAKAVTHTTKSNTLLLGNGDVASYSDAEEKCKLSQCDGVLVGRAAQGNPWFFSQAIPTKDERLRVALEHCRHFWQHFPPSAFVRMRKHLADYCRDFAGAAELRRTLMRVHTLSEVETILASI
jgi:tRNA-dihydrouridine synthase B